MATNYEETSEIILAVLRDRSPNPTKGLHSLLKRLGHTGPEFYDGVIKHGEKMKFSTAQWFEFHCKIRHWRLFREKSLMDKLSPQQRQILGVD